MSIVNSLQGDFFCSQATTPDLQEIFQGIDPRKLKRNSSAIWEEHTNFTQMEMDATVEEDENISD